MRYPTLNDVEGQVRRTFRSDYEGDKIKVDVRRDGEGYTIEIEKMYSYVSLKLSQLLELANFFDTLNINDTRYHTNGCETCDYGSSYKITLTVMPNRG